MTSKKKADHYNRIDTVLKEKNISAYRLHKDTGFTYQNVHNYVKNKKQPTLKTLFKIAEVLECNPKDLLNS